MIVVDIGLESWADCALSTNVWEKSKCHYSVWKASWFLVSHLKLMFSSLTNPFQHCINLGKKMYTINTSICCDQAVTPWPGWPGWQGWPGLIRHPGQIRQLWSSIAFSFQFWGLRSVPDSHGMPWLTTATPQIQWYELPQKKHRHLMGIPVYPILQVPNTSGCHKQFCSMIQPIKPGSISISNYCINESMCLCIDVVCVVCVVRIAHVVLYCIVLYCIGNSN